MKLLFPTLPSVLFASVAFAQHPKPASIFDYMVMNVCLRSDGSVSESNPLDCPIADQRDVRPNDLVPYVHSDYPERQASNSCRSLGPSQRAAFPLDTRGSDGAKNEYPLIVAWTDYPPRKEPCGFGTFDSRDTATLLTVAEDYASLIGAFHHKRWFLTIGAGYNSPSTKGISRFLGTWSFPAVVPPYGEVGWGVFERKTLPFRDDDFDRSFPPTDPSLRLTKTIQFWKHIEYSYGTPSQRTKPLSTLLHIPFTQISETGDAPGETRGSEHFYLTRELGYVTRWESWAREDGNKDVMGLAQKAYGNANCSLPATIEGDITPHLNVGPVEEDRQLAVYKQRITVKAKDGSRSTHTWYMTGCHDFSMVLPVTPYNLNEKVNETTFGKNFVDLFSSSR